MSPAGRDRDVPTPGTQTPGMQTPGMQSPYVPTLDEMTAHARRCGLGRLSTAHLERMRELVPIVAQAGLQVRRVPRKEDAPAPGFRLAGS